ncbi:2 3-bisphosphoglycerate-dependent phosphoglycerate mutase-like [Prunus yedoensis var. nudiflora]|uniref:2 3-bisphosphoglycerate-dependent phosphoglycerate mutase-like n=1 Tax=Prunus yedoensis var. nudiflora TaxID=2094558 RepID=A0A314Y376_PRUYE|nr:2 3-bisphosphoglycerate-dependent phosphoglycerate mutase-like [Prunus yedoensis var. nudiflora]
MEEALQATKILAEDCRNRGTAFRLGVFPYSRIQSCEKQVQFAAGRDPRPGQLGSLIHTLSNCIELEGRTHTPKWNWTRCEKNWQHMSQNGFLIELNIPSFYMSF